MRFLILGAAFAVSTSGAVFAEDKAGPADPAGKPQIVALATVPVEAAQPAKAAEQPPEKSAVVAAKPAAPAKTLVAEIDLSSQTMTVSANGATIHTWKISSGRAGYLTPTGTFRPSWMSRMHYSRQYDDAPMPYSVFFNGGIATHGTAAVGMLGRPASHGCIRLHTANARTFYDLVTKHGKAQTRIVVKGSTPIRSVPVASRRTRMVPGYAYGGGYAYGRVYAPQGYAAWQQPRVRQAPVRRYVQATGRRMIYPGDRY